MTAARKKVVSGATTRKKKNARRVMVKKKENIRGEPKKTLVPSSVGRGSMLKNARWRLIAITCCMKGKRGISALARNAMKSDISGPAPAICASSNSVVLLNSLPNLRADMVLMEVEVRVATLSTPSVRKRKRRGMMMPSGMDLMGPRRWDDAAYEKRLMLQMRIEDSQPALFALILCAAS